GIRDFHVTGVQTCALPILLRRVPDQDRLVRGDRVDLAVEEVLDAGGVQVVLHGLHLGEVLLDVLDRRRAGGRADGLAVEVGDVRSEERRVGTGCMYMGQVV